MRIEGLVVGGGKWEEKNRDRVMGFNSGRWMGDEWRERNLFENVSCYNTNESLSNG